MSTEEIPQSSRDGANPQSPRRTGANPILPFDENQTRLFFEAVKVLLEKSAKPEERPVKAPQPSLFKGDPEDLERFLRQLENVFALEHRTFQEDIRKIRYAQLAAKKQGC